MANTEIAPNWRVLRLNESEHCNPEFLARCGGKLWGVYVYDSNSVFHYCSPEKLYQLHLVYFTAETSPDDDEAAEALENELIEATFGCSDSDLVGASFIDSLPATEWEDLNLDSDATDDDAREAAHANRRW